MRRYFSFWEEVHGINETIYLSRLFCFITDFQGHFDSFHFLHFDPTFR